MWIKQLRLQNFQSYSDQTFDFHPNFNCLVGTGNSGKSAVVRALSFLLYGKWDTSWVKSGESSCIITLVTDSNVKVVREKGKKVNKYTVRFPGKQEQIYENFGTTIPEDIERLLGIFKVNVGSKDQLSLNISNQLDPLFLLSDTGSFRAKVFGNLSKAHYLDYALKEINKEKRHKAAEKTLYEKQRNELEEELKTYDGLDKQIEEFEAIKRRMLEFGKQIKFIEDVKKLQERTKIWKAKYSIEKDTQRKLLSINFSKINELDRNASTIRELKSLDSKLQGCLSKYGSLEEVTKNLSEDKKELVTKYIDILKSNKKCPVCFNDIDMDRLDNFLEFV